VPDDLYRAPQSELIEPPVAHAPMLASRGARLGATLLDQLALGLAITLPLLAILSGKSALDFSDRTRLGLEVIVGGVFVSAVLAVNLALMARHGQTLGKRWLGIKVVRSDGSPLTLGRYVGLRVLPVNLLAQVPLLGVFVALADPLMIFRMSQKCLHDEIADTIVVEA
jgi:uncharacterized RDD family membrane protein YckC